MPKITIYHFLFLGLLLFSQTSVKAGIREDFHNKKNTAENLKSLINKTYHPSSALTSAYQGLAQCMMAEHAFLPTTKMGYFNKGKHKIDEAIVTENNQVELRYIRLIVQLNAPSFLEYNRDITSDFDFFSTYLKNTVIDQQWKIKFIDVLLTTEKITANQRATLIEMKSNNYE